MQRSMARNNVMLMPLSADDKPQVLRKLQGRAHFETVLTATTAPRYDKNSSGNSGPSLPSWFVQTHGDCVRKSAILGTESCTKAWPVNLTVSVSSPNWTQVKFNGSGWRAFVTCNGLLEGDLLIFALKAMSEFEVYVFRRIEGYNPSRKQTSDPDSSRKKEKQIYECRDVKQLVADEEGTDGSEIIAKRKTVADDATFAPNLPSKFQNSSCRKDSLHLLPGFRRKLTANNVCRRNGSNEKACLEIPQAFLKTHGSRIYSVVKLQGIREESPVRTMPCYITHRERMRHFLKGEWRNFVNENHLQIGQELFFTLTADSFFVVREVPQPPS